MLYMVYNDKTKQIWLWSDSSGTLNQFCQYMVNRLVDGALEDFRLVLGHSEDNITEMTLADYCKEIGVVKQSFAERMASK